MKEITVSQKIIQMTPEMREKYVADLKARNKKARDSRWLRTGIIHMLAIVLMIAGIVGGIIATCVIFHYAGQTGASLGEAAVHAVMETLLMVCPGLILGNIAFESEQTNRRKDQEDRQRYKTIRDQVTELKRAVG